MRRTSRCAFVCLALFLNVGATHAKCKVTSGPLSFGPYDPLTGSMSSTSGVIAVSCSESPSPNVRVSATPSAVSGTFAPRRMRQTGGQETLAYNLYVDPGGNGVWGDGSGGTLTLSDNVQPGQSWIVTIYAKLPPGQDVTPGAYTDTISVVVEF